MADIVKKLFKKISLSLETNGEGKRVLKTDKPLCHVIRYEIYFDIDLTEKMNTVRSDPTDDPVIYIEYGGLNGPRFSIVTRYSYERMFYVKGISAGEQFDVVPVRFIVCGYETVKVESKDIEKYIYDNENIQSKISGADLEKLFKYEIGS